LKRLLLWASLAAAALAQPLPPPITLDARGALGDIVRFGRPFQAEVDVTLNDGSLAGECEVELDGSMPGEVRSVAPLRLALGRQTLTLPYLSGSYNSQAKLKGVPQHLESSVGVSTNMATDQDFVVLTLTPRKGHFAYLGGYKNLLKQGEFRINRPTRLDNLPAEWWTYLGHDAIIVHDLPSLKLNAEVEKALLQWTQSGGSLVLVSNLDPHEYRDTAFQSVLPLRPERTENGIVVGQAPTSAVRLKHGSQPLLLRSRYGAGWIYQATAPAVAAETLGNKVTTQLWQQVLSEDRGWQFRKTAFERFERLSVLPELPAPATSALAWYLAVYVLVAIPGIYIYLRRKDQVLRLILVVPVTSLLFAGGAYYFNSLGRGRELVVRELGVAWLPSGQQRLVADHTGVLFSPISAEFQVPMPEKTLLRPDPEGNRAEQHVLACRGRTLVMENERLPQWGVSRWRSLSIRELPGTVTMRSSKHGNQWELDIDNRSGLELKDAVFVPDFQQCSDALVVPQGRKEFTVTASANQPTLDNYLAQPHLALNDENPYTFKSQVEAVRGGRPALLGWTDAEVFAAFIPEGLKPRSFRRTLVVVTEDAP
jgi:hypothetical protein